MLGMFQQAKQVKSRVENLVRLNIELARQEGKRKATLLAVAAGFGALAAVLVVYAIGFAFASAAAGLADAVPLWAALLIVAAILLALAAVASFVAQHYARKLSPAPPKSQPQPEPVAPEVADHA